MKTGVGGEMRIVALTEVHGHTVEEIGVVGGMVGSKTVETECKSLVYRLAHPGAIVGIIKICAHVYQHDHLIGTLHFNGIVGVRYLSTFRSHTQVAGKSHTAGAEHRIVYFTRKNNSLIGDVEIALAEKISGEGHGDSTRFVG